jgi:catechol 2,3-dioxygenase-like lactoylglutathione lyase family enzyme
MSEPRIVGLNHVHIVCSDLPASERWFVDGLGAELVERRESRGMPTVELSLAGVRVLLRSGERLTGGEAGFGLDHLALDVAGVDALVEQLQARGVEIARGPQDSPRNRVAFIRGPDDLVVELVQPAGS